MIHWWFWRCSCGRYVYEGDIADVCSWRIPGIHGFCLPLFLAECKINHIHYLREIGW